MNYLYHLPQKFRFILCIPYLIVALMVLAGCGICLTIWACAKVIKQCWNGEAPYRSTTQYFSEAIEKEKHG